MRKLLGLLLLLSPALLAEIPPATRTHLPQDYTRTTCTSTVPACRTIPQSQFAEVASFRGKDIGQEWVDAHWDEVTAVMAPICERITTCFATPGNDYLFCNDVASREAIATCSRYPEGSADHEKCVNMMSVYMVGIDRNSLPAWTELQACGRAQQPANAPVRTFEYWIEPSTFSLDQTARFHVYALDTEKKVAVQAKLLIESKTPIFSDDSADGLPTSFHEVIWKPRLVRVPNAAGHRDLVAPKVSIEAPGYRTETFTLPVTVPTMKVEMKPSVSKLKRGPNTVTVVAHDASTGEPVEARVMGNDAVLGKTNVPFVLEWKKGQKRPEIWVTSLYDRYSDVVVARAGK